MSNLSKVVGIGASAGGLEAIERFFVSVPTNTNCAFIVVQHLSPQFKSLMNELLGKYTSMRIEVVDHKVKIEPNCIYLIPPSNNIVIKDEHIIPIVRNDEDNKLNLPIDLLFTSLGKEYKEKAVAIILSGTGTDGSRGIEVVKQNGGFVVVQDPGSAKFDGMPNAALDVGVEDAILSPIRIGEFLVAILENNGLIPVTANLSIEEQSLRTIQSILTHIKRTHNVDFHLYRMPTIYRRIDKRMHVAGAETLEEYEQLIKSDKNESKILCEELLINVTRFFRDKDAFEYLEEEIIPAIFRDDEDNSPIRVWSLACSTGEEPYSIAYLLHKYKKSIGSNREISIFATDLDAKAVRFASDGMYSDNSVSEISADIKAEMFDQTPQGYRIKKELRESIVFTKHNALKDPPFINLDLLVCRNFLIYLKPTTQLSLMNHFNFSLKQNAYLFLGKSESIGRLSDDFLELEGQRKFYKKIKNLQQRELSFVRSNNTELSEMTQKLHNTTPREKMKSSLLYEFNEFTDFLVRDYAPSCVFINQTFDVLYMNGELDRILTFPQRITGQFNLLRMTNEESGLVFRNGVRKILDEGKPVTYNDITFTKRDQDFNIDIRFVPYLHTEQENNVILVEFLNIRDNLDQEDSSPLTEDDYLRDRLRTLEVELKSAQQENRALSQQIDAHNKELNATNEELFSVNTELQEKIGELKDANQDINNLLEGINIGTIFLDKELNIRRFTPSLKLHFNLKNDDIGRNIVHFSTNLINANIQESCLSVLSSMEPHEDEIENVNGRHYLNRILPYLNNNDDIDGLIITFTDITKLKETERHVVESEQRFKLAVEGTNDGIWDWIDVNKQEEWWSPQFYNLIGYNEEELPASFPSFLSILHPDDHEKCSQAVQDHFEKNIPFDITYRLRTKNKGYRWFKGKAGVSRNENGDVVRMVGSISDVHEDIQTKEELLHKQQTLDTIIEGTMAGYWDWHIPENYEYMSDGFKSMFGYEPHEIADTPDWWQKNIHPDELAGVFEIFNKHVETKGEFPYDNLVRYKHKEGHWVWVYCRGKVIEWNENDEPLRMVGSHVNITQLVNTEETLKARTVELEKINQELEQFAYIATHDLRAPVLNLQALVKLFKSKDLLNESNSRIMNRIESSVLSFNETLHDLIDITNLRKKENEGVVDIILSEKFQEQIDMINEQYACEPIIHLDLKVKAVKYFPGHVKSIFYNLYSNAIKYRRQGIPTEIKISTYDEGEYFVLEVEDNGQGFDLKHLDKVFAMFQRLNNDVEGKGVGLFIIKSLIETHGGTIDVQSEVNKGSKFKVKLIEKNILTKTINKG